ncbi:MAG TPA: type 4a pilus biogenesis protein PilO [Polyangiaceae bacterium]|jgi:type IV pilus assembly protein PilO|nr:type 4a pilus biogenesis protein PilO [Polyangiaceae bacterium]
MARPSPLSRINLPTKVGIGLILVVLVAVVYFVVFYGDLSTSISAEQGRGRQLTGDLADAQKAQHAYQMDLAELADRQQRQRELNKILPATTEYPAFLSAVQAVANVAGVSLTAWTPQDESPDQFYARVPMRVELTGRFHQIAKFFYNVGQLDRIINMEDISLTDPVQKGDEVTLKVSALATAFHSIDESKRPVRKVQ